MLIALICGKGAEKFAMYTHPRILLRRNFKAKQAQLDKANWEAVLKKKKESMLELTHKIFYLNKYPQI